MFFYIAIYISASLFIFLYSKTENKNLAFIFKWTSFLILFIPIALRYNIGTDYENYIWSIVSGNYKETFEIGWLILIEIILGLNLDLQWFFVIPAFLSLLIIFSFAKKEYTWIIVITYILTMYIFSYNAVRSEFALCILLLAIKAFLNKKRLKMLFWIFISCLFHKSMIVVGFVLILCEVNLKFLNSKVNLIIFICIIVLHYVGIANLLMNNVIAYTPYANYEFNPFYNTDADIKSGIGVFLILIVCIIILIFSKKFEARLYNLSTIFMFCFAFAQILNLEIHIFFRLKATFMLSFLIGMYVLYLSKTKNSKIAFYIALSILTLLYISNLYREQSEVIPYQSIF